MTAIEPIPEFLRKFPCSRCGTPCYRIAYIGPRLICVQCFAIEVRRVEAAQ